jgi:WD40 repeat protein
MICHRSPISGVASHASRYVATAGYDNQIILWNMETNEALTRAFHDHLANQCAFNTEGSRLVSASSDYTARIWSVPDLRLRAVLGDHEDDVEMAIFHPAHDLVATASRDHAVRVFSTDGRLVHRFGGHTADALSVQWVLGTTDLISSGDDGTIRRWSLNDRCEVAAFDLGGVETDTVVVSPGGVIYAGTDAGDIIVLAGEKRYSVAAHAAGVKRLAYSPASELLISLSYDRSLKIWSARSEGLRLVGSAAIPADIWARACAFGPGTSLFFGSFGGRFRRYDYGTKQWNEPAPPTAGFNAVCAVGMTRYAIGDAGRLWRNGAVERELGSLCNFLLPWGDRLLTGGQMGILFDALSGDVLYEHRSPLNCGVAYQVGRESRVLIGTYTGEGLVFKRSAAGKIEFISAVRLHDNAVKGVAQSQDKIFSVCADTSCAWTDAATNVVQNRIEQAHGRIANGCASLPDGRFISISRDRLLRLWEASEVRTFETPHQNSIKSIAVDTDGRFVASGSYAGHLGIFDLQTHRWPWFARVSPAGVSSLFYDEARRCFLASCYDGEIYEAGLPTDGR